MSIQCTLENITNFEWIKLFSIIPGIIAIIYTLCNKPNDRETTIRKFYYSICLLIFGILVNCFPDIKHISNEGYLSLTNEVSSYVSFFIIFFIIIIIFDNLIISDRPFSFKEIGFLGTKFIKEERLQTVTNQAEYITSLETGIESINKVNTYINDLIQEEISRQSLHNFSIDYNALLRKIIIYFFNSRQLSAKVELFNYNNGNFYEDIFSDGGAIEGLRSSQQNTIKKTINNTSHIYFKYSENENILILNLFNTISQEKIILIVKSCEVINEKDIHLIRSFNLTYQLFLATSTQQ